MNRSVFLDTSFLLELFGIEGRCTLETRQKARDAYKKALSDKDRIYVPVGCVLELGNHIGHVRDGDLRRRYAEALANALDGDYWTILFIENTDHLQETADRFADEYVQQRLGLTDSFTIDSAKSTAAQYTGLDHRIEIWTEDGDLAAHSPNSVSVFPEMPDGG